MTATQTVRSELIRTKPFFVSDEVRQGKSRERDGEEEKWKVILAFVKNRFVRVKLQLA